jgi:glucose/arabinose dehydrogenase
VRERSRATRSRRTRSAAVEGFRPEQGRNFRTVVLDVAPMPPHASIARLYPSTRNRNLDRVTRWFVLSVFAVLAAQAVACRASSTQDATVLVLADGGANDGGGGPPGADSGVIGPRADASASDAARSSDASVHLDAETGHLDATVDADTGPRDIGPYFCDLGGDAPGLTVPPEFCIRRFASVACPRNLRFAPNGDVFVASPSEGTPGGAPLGLGAIVVLPDDDHDGKADAIVTYAQTPELRSVHGLAFTRSNAQLLYTVADGVWSVPYQSNDRHMQMTGLSRIADLTGSTRWTHTVAEATDGRIYASIGQYDSNFCPSQPRDGAIVRIGGTSPIEGEVVVTGMRNPMYTRCTVWGPCFGAELSGDGWSGIGGVEKLFLFHDGDDLGYPCCVDRNQPTSGVDGMTPDCSNVTSGVQTIPLHDTPFGFDWDVDGNFPAPYTNGFFVAQHGSFASWVGAGVSWAPIDPGTHYPSQAVQPFVTGFGHGAVEGRPADVVFAPDGRMFIADDQGGAVYWIAPRTLRRP